MISHRPASAQGPDLSDDGTLAISVQQAIAQGLDDLSRSWGRLEACSPALASCRIAERLEAHRRQPQRSPLSPWLYLSYYRLGRHLAGGGDSEALPMTPAELLAQIDTPPPTGTVLSWGDAGAAPESQWQAMLALFQDGGDFIADLEAPATDIYPRLAAAITEARRLIRQADRALAELMDQLLPLVVLALPGPAARSLKQGFGGATTFFFRGGSLVHGSTLHTLPSVLEVLVHEYAHAELFTLAQEQHLCRNADSERHAVRIRSDARPMNGILHGLHVSSRVAGLCEKILAQGLPWRSDRQALLADLESQRDHALSNGRSCLEAVLQHGDLTPLGEAVTLAAAARLHRPRNSLSPPA